ncbi:prepilin-type N-terminal cleavage/methylation domain-containing protein [Desulfocapsa sulfexigens DSM 10523]|uniref:Prepilin-type N-terminal cleavage/methylation domain-containing protein n=1 Tax=Desulfocapsa sulfexigens (strain DSM 10523 / SB164P1) TaxID=1167006 RepID=M1PQZ4_DESSD|nr:prepilin-type N-terminal cleavage/methylation domain-containing protein [Desulfocapsa sulfexigens]AGF78816.1 prepilin-type N-terminal cleavage/methylation domain-containing protein [Desulfocapsa sulfexigens DSM 10523]
MLKKMKVNRNKKGFSLVELLTVVAVIAILAAIAIPQYSAYRNKAFIAVLKSDAHTLANAQVAYFTDHGTYSNTAAAVQTAIYGGNNISPDTTVGNWVGNSTSFSFTTTDNVHGGLVVTYDSDAGGIQ